MSISARQNEILKIVSDRVYISVNELAAMTFTSPSSIRRDLSTLQNLGLVNRSYGGVTLSGNVSGVASFYDRANQNVKEKRLIAKKASALLKEGQSILLDSSSTAGFLLPYIAKLEYATVFTNNLETALNASKLGIDVHCLGGRSVNGSAALTGAQTCTALSSIKVDIMFFSSQYLSEDGTISDSTEEENYVRSLMLKQAKKTVFLCDSGKFGKGSLYKLTDLDNVDFAVFDQPFEDLKTEAEIL